MKLYQVINGDFRDKMKDLPDHSINLIITDPPYNKNKDFANDNLSEKNYKEMIRDLCYYSQKKLKKTGVIYCFINNEMLSTLIEIFNEYFLFQNIIVWYFEQSYSHPGDNYSNRCEYILYYTVSKEFTFNELREKPSKSTIKRWEKYVDENGNVPYDSLMPSLQKRYKKENYERNPINIYRGALQGNVFFCKRPRMKEREIFNHETQKPVDLVDKLVLISSNENDIVLDPFAGSGTMLVSAIKNYRKCIGIEINEEYCNLIKQRLKKIKINKKVY